MHVFFFPISIFLSFRRGRNGKKKGSFRSSFQLFLLFREGVEDGEKNEESSFSSLFSFFLFLFFRFSDFFFLLFVPLSCFGGEMGVGGSRNFSSSFSCFIPFFGENKGGSTGKNRRKFFLFFILNFVLFSSWKPFWFSVFGEKRREMGG